MSEIPMKKLGFQHDPTSSPSKGDMVQVLGMVSDLTAAIGSLAQAVASIVDRLERVEDVTVNDVPGPTEGAEEKVQSPEEGKTGKA